MTQPSRLTELAPETRLRVTYGDSCCTKIAAGYFVGYDADSLRLQVAAPDERLALPWPSIRSVESLHQSSRAGTGALVGLATGTIAGYIIGYSNTCSDCDGDWRPLGGIVGGILGALTGTAFGALTGLGVEHDVWAPVTDLPMPPTGRR